LFALNILAGIHFLKKYALYFPPVLSYMLHYIIYVGINIKGRPVFIDGGWCGVEQLKKTPSFSEKCEKNHVGGARGEGGYSQENLVGVCGPLPKTLTLSMTKICDFPYPIYDLTKNLIPYL